MIIGLWEISERGHKGGGKKQFYRKSEEMLKLWETMISLI